MDYYKNNIACCLVFILMFTCFSIPVLSQHTVVQTEGAVSYITGRSIYVKFENTAGISAGDTLYVANNQQLVPALVVQHLSSISCLCQPISEQGFKVSDKVIAKKKLPLPEKNTQTEKTNEKSDTDVATSVIASGEKKVYEKTSSEMLTGRVSVASYSNFSTLGESSNKLRYTIVTNVGNPGKTALSAETYISFTHKLNEWDKVQENIYTALKVYSLALRYDVRDKASVWAGRKINPSIANIGAIDGIQFEYHPDKFFAGIAGGSRPDFNDYSFNPSLFEYGLYAGQNTNLKNGNLQSSLAIFEQKNNGNTDRRFLYLQHNNSAVKNLNIFFSCELDLYGVTDSIPQNKVTLTGLYFSARYRITPRLSVFASYDNRKNVIYYETFRNYIDELIHQASRQGYRLNLNYRPVNYLIFGLNGGYRFMKTDPEPTVTLNGYGTWSAIPVLNASFTLSADLIQTSYMNGQVYGARFIKDFFNNRFQTSLYYRYSDFSYTYQMNSVRQNIAEIDLSYQAGKKLYFSANYEITFHKEQNYNRLYLNLRRKF